MVPVIATILDNYIKVVDRCREKAEEAKKAQEQRLHHTSRSSEHRSSHKGASFGNRASRFESEFRASRRQPPPPSIDIPATFTNPPLTGGLDAMDTTPTGPQFALTSPPERTTFSVNRHHHHHHHHHHRGQDARQHFLPASRHNLQPLATAVPSMDTADGFNIRPVRDVDRLPSMVPGFHGGLTSQPESPTTPLPPTQMRSPTVRPTALSAPSIRSRRRPSIRHQASLVGESEDPNADSMASDESGDPEISAVPADIHRKACCSDSIKMIHGGARIPQYNSGGLGTLGIRICTSLGGARSRWIALFSGVHGDVFRVARSFARGALVC